MHAHRDRDDNADHVLKDREHGRDQEKHEHLRPPTFKSDTLAPNPTVVKNAIMNGACSLVSKVAIDTSRPPRHVHHQRHQQAPDDRGGHVVPAEHRQDRTHAESQKKHDAAESDRID